MLFRVDPSSPASLADQIAAQVRAGLVDRSIEPGAKLPAARELATGLDVNMHTVLRAYQQLRDEGLIELRRGRGATVRTGADVSTLGLRQLARDLLEQAGRLGMSTDDVIELLHEVTP